MQSLCIFCGSQMGSRPEYKEAAQTVGRLLAERSIRLVYGGATVGLMGGLADSCLGAGGQVIGVMPDSLVRHEIAHRGLTELRIVTTMHERKALMADLSDAFLAMPGGVGTFEEFFEVWTWGQLGLHDKPIGLLNVSGYFDPLVAMVLHGKSEGFMKQRHLDTLRVSADPADIVATLIAGSPAR